MSRQIRIEVVLEVPDDREPAEYEWVAQTVVEQLEEDEKLVGGRYFDLTPL